jgi:CBS domain-containing protein
MSAYYYTPPQLENINTRVTAGETPETTVRQLLRWFAAERRGANVVSAIRGALRKLDLDTKPSFVYTWIDGTIGFYRREPDVASIPEGTATPLTSGFSDYFPEVAEVTADGNSEILQDVSPNVVGGAPEDPTYRIGKLNAANQSPLRVAPDATLSEAVTIMLRHDFSQLPVMTSDREVKGVVSWRSIASRLTLGRDCKMVRDCMEKNVEIVDADWSLFRVIEIISQDDFVLVRDSTRRISGIVTAADLGQSFHQLGRPF